jgi:hypothetical protein
MKKDTLKHTLNFMTVCSKDRIKIPSFLLFISLLLLLVSCRKNEDTVGAEFIDGILGMDVITTDTTSLITYTTIHDSIPSRGLTYYILGDMNDPSFGYSRASIITQFDLPAQNYKWASDNITIDSVVLQIGYTSATSVYGNTSSLQKINVYELDELLVNSRDSSYYSNRTYPKRTPTPIGSWTGSFNKLGDSVYVSGLTAGLTPHLRIRLDNADFVERLRTAPSQGQFVNTETFQKYIKGLIIMPETSPQNPGEGAVAYMNLKNSITSVVVYYAGGTQKAEFPIYKTETVKANSYSHVYNPAITLQPMKSGTHQTTAYIQPMAGLKMRILVPHLFELVKDKKVAITGAELIFTPLQGGAPAPYSLPDKVRLVSADSLGRNELVVDFLEAHFGGDYNSSTGTYHFNIIRHIQQLLTQYKNNNLNLNYGFSLIVQADNPIVANRLILDTNPGKIKLKLSYTVIK